MMDIIFNIANGVGFLSWVLIAVFAKKNMVLNMVQFGVITALAIKYTVLIFPIFANFSAENFNTISNIRSLFATDGFLLAGWVHYLAFDLFVGIYIIKTNQKIGLSRSLYTICLPFTFLFGPIGLLMFYTLKLVKS